MKKLIYIILGLIIGGSALTASAQVRNFTSLQLAPAPSNGNCLTTDGVSNLWSTCASGGGGGGAGTWATTTSQTAGRLINYPLNTTDIVVVGSNSTTSAEFYYDPNTFNFFVKSASSTIAGPLNVVGAFTSLGNFIFGGDTFDELVGDGLDISSGDLIFDCSDVAGTGITCSGEDITAEVITAGDALTRTGDDIDFDGGASPSGDLGGTWASPSVTDDSHSHTSGTLSGIDISADTNLTAGDNLTLTNDDLDLDTTLTSMTAATFSGLVSAGSMSLANSSFLGFMGAAAVDATNYSLFGNTALTLLNARSGASIGFRINNTDVANFSTTGGYGFGATYYNLDPGQNNMTVEGNLGVGVSAPTQKLDVLGNVLITGNSTTTNATTTNALNASGNLSFYGEIMPDGLACANGEILKKTATNDWDCATDATSAGGGTFPFDPTTNYTTSVVSTTTPIWFKASPYSLMASSTALIDTLYVSTTTATSTIINDLQIGAGAIGNNKVRITADRVFSPSTSVGGLLSIINTSNTGNGLLVYTNNGGTSAGNLVNFRCDNALMAHDCARIDNDGLGDGLSVIGTAAGSNAISASNTGLDHTINSAYTGSTANKGGLNVTSTNTTGSVFQISGVSVGLGIGKISHTGVGDADSSVLSLAASDTGYLGQGIFLDMETVNTTQKLLNLRADGNEELTLTPLGLGQGTTTPYFQLQIASSTGSQIALSNADATSPRFNFRAVGTSFYFATSSPSTFATSTTPIFTVDSTNTVTFGNSQATCIALTGSAGLCDGADASVAGGDPNSKWATTTLGDSIIPNGAIKVGIGTSTPFSTLSVSTTSANALNLPLFTVASSTHQSLFQVLSGGNVKVGAGTPQIAFDGVNGSTTLQKFTFTTATGTAATTTNSFSTTASSTNLFSSAVNFGSSILSIVSNVLTGLGVWDLGGATSLEIPNGSACTPNVTGQECIDTTNDQFVYFGATVKRVITPFQDLGFAYATTTWSGTTTLRIGPSPAAITVTNAYCETNTGTVGVSLYDGTNRALYMPTASTTINNFLYTASNNSFTAGETIRVDIGTPASSPTQLSCRLTYTRDAT